MNLIFLIVIVVKVHQDFYCLTNYMAPKLIDAASKSFLLHRRLFIRNYTATCRAIQYYVISYFFVINLLLDDASQVLWHHHCRTILHQFKNCIRHETRVVTHMGALSRRYPLSFIGSSLIADVIQNVNGFLNIILYHLHIHIFASDRHLSFKSLWNHSRRTK